MADAPDWTRDGTDWPNRDASVFVSAGGLRWHVQIAGTGPTLLLLHGTGAATHSWRDLFPLLMQNFTVIAPDLPGHGFTEAPPESGFSLPGMAAGVTALLEQLGQRPVLVAGHSAGAAILARMCLDGLPATHLVSLNGAFVPFGGSIGPMLAPLSKMIGRSTLLPRVFAWQAGDPAVVARLIRGTGSTIDARGLALYARLMRRPGHAAAALGMMANWDLVPILADLPLLRPKLHLVVGSQDRTIPPSDAARIAKLVPGALVTTLPGLGHLAHEEDPAAVAALIRRLASPA